ncbi:sigma-54-dependent Fis family transcriptional regulator [Dechloromonas sp. HYN0024]|uniref:sigma-54-dependent Fis family transcriptional regulator n=1 Tax=Dechloromonas sp. HYN0024 TaxID=2231055 RepID=UPI000E4507E2|nr:sigma-54-dependent Fis family transcriptional regulator [Dechloromonas sp. HYN0024]AXS81393.1 sigma-54-dependent Fis family transcriptional regulator [Dechloromonas sp. HYN0024]
MEQLQLATELNGQRLQRARQLFFDEGYVPDGLIDPIILRSWQRCRHFGLNENNIIPATEGMDLPTLKAERNRNRFLLAQGRPIMEHIYEQIRKSGSMVILADANGLLLETIGDSDFVYRADRVALTSGASWGEPHRGTNAIGTAITEKSPVSTIGGEHFFERNSFLTCSASPIFGPDGCLVGVLDISSDYRNYHQHTLGLVCMSTAIVERRLFESAYSRDLLVCFHTRSDYLGSPKEGIAAVSPDGQILAINRNGTELLGIRQEDAVNRDFSLVFKSNLSTLIDRLRHAPQRRLEINTNGKFLFFQLRGQFPSLAIASRIEDAQAIMPMANSPEAISPSGPTLDTLSDGDPLLQAAIERARRMLGKDIPILIQGESGAGKEMFAKAFHNSGPRSRGPFVALNCASIPETLIESELFGYQGGAFTGARKEGAPGKIQQAHGGTLFLDEIGDMPHNLQARLLRVLQERCVTPLGSTRAIQVDISLVCATHRKLRDEVARGHFREDLYYRLNGMSVTIPPLRERTDIQSLVAKITATETTHRGLQVYFSEEAQHAIKRYSWPGNIRQLFNVIRVAIALLDDDESLITENHLPEELFEPAKASRHPRRTFQPRIEAPPSDVMSMDAIGRQAAINALESAGGNVTLAARHLGISRNTLYRKLGRT